MARYTCSFTVALPADHLQQSLRDILESCNFEVVYDKADYIRGREFPGQVSFTKLAEVEFLIDKTTATETELNINVVMKNEELPLKLDNHCQQMFDRLTQAIASSSDFQLVKTVTEA